MKSGDSGDIHSTGHVARCFFVSSPSQWSRPCFIGTSLPVRFTTSTVSTIDTPPTASSHMTSVICASPD